MQYIKVWILSLLLIRATSACAAVDIEATHFNNIQREPDAVTVFTEAGSLELNPKGKGLWSQTNTKVKVRFHLQGNGLVIELEAPNVPVTVVQTRWDAKMAPDWKYLGDAWERAYGDLEWKPLDAKRVMPWYFLASNGALTHGYGVKTGPSALCYWTTEDNGILLHANVQCGGVGVELGDRKLEVCTVVSRMGQPKEDSFAAAQSFCKVMCPKPRLPKQPVYGFNDWYCTYGHDTADKFLADVSYVVSLNPKKSNRPFAVVDDGWQWRGKKNENPGLWDQIDPAFSKTLDMAQFAKKVVALHARPGLWYRPLIANADHPQSWRLQRDRSILDPTVPEVRALIRQCMTRFHGWGYEMIKHDYTTYDICGLWGMKMGAEVTKTGWAFADHSRTTAEVIRDLYQDIRAAAGNDTLIIGCNTMGHLSAGIFELQRIGDDTSGMEWDRTRKMGVNCLAFRAPQHGTFFAVDADCAGQTKSNSVPWEKNSQWLDLLATSGTPLFVSFPHETVSPEQEKALKAALAAASSRQPVGKPLDWQTSRTPSQWHMGKKEKKYTW